MAEVEERKENQSDFYQLLGVSQDASLKEIKAKFRKLSLLYHPDKEGGDEQKYLQIKKAYKILSDPKKRSEYNSCLSTTFNELKQQERDTEYRLNDSFLKEEVEETGTKKVVFDHDKFMTEFEKSRNKTENQELFDPTKHQKKEKTFEELLAERDNDLNSFQNNLKSDIFNPKDNNEGFNKVFLEYQKQKGFGATQIKEVNDPNDPNAGPFASVNFGETDFSGFSSSLNNMMSSMKFHDDDIVTSQRGISQEEIDARMNEYKNQTKDLEVDKEDDPKKDEFFKKDLTCGRFLNNDEAPISVSITQLNDNNLHMTKEEEDSVMNEEVEK